ncbi:MAG: hypothetical protein A4E34_00118 [Methanoregula sp. PtaU1.Bin006]|nr:MAG: hypothetical protein A4E34_00118 [Methanoregula sp. PtaU1.Bin006]
MKSPTLGYLRSAMRIVKIIFMTISLHRTCRVTILFPGTSNKNNAYSSPISGFVR